MERKLIISDLLRKAWQSLVAQIWVLAGLVIGYTIISLLLTCTMPYVGFPGRTALGVGGVLLHQQTNLLQGQERVELQQPFHVPVVRVHPELIELVRRRALRVEPHRSCFRLAELRARRREQEGLRQAEGLAAARLSDVLRPRQQVPLLVVSPHLQLAAVVIVEVLEVDGLQEHVGELRVGYPLLRVLKPALDVLPGDEVVDGEVLPHVV